MKNNLVHIGNHKDWECYKNSEGFIEGYKTMGNRLVNGKNMGTDIKRVVSNATDFDGFIIYLKGLNRKLKIKDIPLKVAQLPKLFPDE